MIDNFVLIMGAMKCGTSSLFSHLAQHPQIAPSREKEPNFFADDAHWAQGRAWYEALWDWDPAVHRIAMEGSTHYTKLPVFPNAAERIAQYPGRFRFIYLMRDPIARIESHYDHKRARGEPVQPLDRGIDPHLLDTTRYARQLDEYYRRFDAGDILLLRFDDLAAEPGRILRQVCEFLDVDPDVTFSGTDRQHNRRPQSAEHPLIRRLDASPAARALIGMVPKWPKTLARRILRRPTLERTHLGERHREMVFEALADDLRRLRDDYHVDLSGWRVPATL